MPGRSFFKKKDRSGMTKIDQHWYPTDFYDAADLSVLGPVVEMFLELEMCKENYDYLIAERKLTKENAGGFFYRFIRADSPQAVNIAFTTREEVEDDLLRMFGHLGSEERIFLRRKDRRRSRQFGAPPAVQNNQPMHQVTKQEVRDVFQVATADVYNLVQHGPMTRLFRSEIFLETHRDRQKRAFHRFRPY